MTLVFTKSALNTASNDVLFKSAPNITKKFGRVKKNDACIAKSAVFFQLNATKKSITLLLSVYSSLVED
jgi:hypothetical protein